MKGYSTKYALTKGIQEVEIEELRPGAPTKYGYTKYGAPWPHLRQQLELGVNFFTTHAAAEQAAISMAKKKLRSLNKQVAAMKVLVRKPRWNNT